jgi:hypothetical protein
MPPRFDDKGQRVGCRACHVVFRDRTTRNLAIVPCPVCDLQGQVIDLPIPNTWPSDSAQDEETLP